MNAIVKNILFALAFVPFALKVPYILTTYANSPLERYNFIFWIAILIFAPIFEYVRRKMNIRDNVVRGNKLIAITLGFSVILWGIFYFYKINAACAILGISIIALSLEFRFGRRVFASQIPSFAMAILATPSVGYWLNYYLCFGLNESLSLLLIRHLLILILSGVWIFYAFVYASYPRLMSVAFMILAFGIIIFGRIHSKNLPAGDPCILKIENYSKDNIFTGRDTFMGKNELNFFAGAKKVSRKIFYCDNGAVGALELLVGDNVSNVHPVGICLKSSGWNVESGKSKYINLGENKILVSEIIAEKESEKYRIYAWFSDKDMSIGEFIRFRFLQKNGKQWYHYQIMTTDDPESKNRLESFIKTFLAQ